MRYVLEKLRAGGIRLVAKRLRAIARGRVRSATNDVLRAARATMRRKRYCVLATHAAHGVGARVLEPFPPDGDMVVWLGTSRASRKVAELRRDPRATLIYEDDTKGACVVLSGTVRIVDGAPAGEREALFRPAWVAFWPEGPRDEDFVLLRFEPSRVEVWDAARGITPEPFGLASRHLERRSGRWVAAEETDGQRGDIA